VVPLAAVPLFYAGLTNGWWGDGVGDGWHYAEVMVTAVGLLGSALGVPPPSNQRRIDREEGQEKRLRRRLRPQAKL
jgi:hypothetical protein